MYILQTMIISDAYSKYQYHIVKIQNIKYTKQNTPRVKLL